MRACPGCLLLAFGLFFMKADETCAACLAGADLEGTCDPTTAVDCAGAVNYYCCLAGSECSDNPVLLNWLSKS